MKLGFSTPAACSFNPRRKNKSVGAASCGAVRNNCFYNLVYNTVKLCRTKTTAWPHEMKSAFLEETTESTNVIVEEKCHSFR